MKAIIALMVTIPTIVASHPFPSPAHCPIKGPTHIGHPHTSFALPRSLECPSEFFLHQNSAASHALVSLPTPAPPTLLPPSLHPRPVMTTADELLRLGAHIPMSPHRRDAPGPWCTSCAPGPHISLLEK
jgi:hypothetical protein